MTIPHVQLEALARQICEVKRGAGAYDRKGCKRAYWRKRALKLDAFVSRGPILRGLWRASGWLV